MHRVLIIATLIAALPMLAFAAGQSPAATEKPHPSSSAHANAVAGQADAMRIEACGNLSSTLLEAFDKGDFKAATSNFNSQMLAVVDAQKLGEVQKSIAGQFGKLESRGTPQSVMYQGMAVVSTPMHYEKGDLAAVVACDKDGKVAGFRLNPVAPATSN
ncbi:MAG: hypothetical protein OJF61_000908 [Rhodanobacteraceae bacterium]|jgi:hypothetical protein|nr:MAG: hypothetical protein OJF61_000908 [Rhodanobacteraceae bacterium]